MRFLRLLRTPNAQQWSELSFKMDSGGQRIAIVAKLTENLERASQTSDVDNVGDLQSLASTTNARVALYGYRNPGDGA